MADAVMVQIVPGTPAPPTTWLTRYRTPHIAGVARPFVESTTQPGDLVIEVSSRSGGYVAEVLAAGRRALAVNLNPVALLWAHLDLNPVPFAELQAAVTQLGDAPKSGRPLISHLRDLYASRCPLCNHIGVAEWFAWERDSGRPYAKRVRCPACKSSYEGPVDDQDIASAGEFPATQGPAYHLALGRAAPPEDRLRSRAAELVQLYTRRNLSALMDILYRLPQIDAPLDIRRVVTGLVLDALDRGSSLTPESAPDERPRTLRPPQKFLERNVWMLLEQALESYKVRLDAAPEQHAGAAPAATLAQLLVNPDSGYLLLARSIQALVGPRRERSQLQGNVRSILFEIEPPNAVFLALSALWSAWLWGEESPAGLRTFLGRRRLDWEWYEHSLSVALRQVRRLMHPDGALLLIIRSQQRDLIGAVMGAAETANLSRAAWVAAPPSGYRLALSVQNETGGLRDARETCEGILRRRGEPVRRDRLEIWCALASGGEDVPTLNPTANAALTELGTDYVWLSSSTNADSPVADRVEERILELLEARDYQLSIELVAALYGSFSGILSPDPAVVEACLDSYARRLPEGALQLRAESEPANRRARVQRIAGEIKQLGARLGYRILPRLRPDIIWRERGQRVYAWRCSATGLLAPHLLKSPPPSDGYRCLVLPDSHADLVKLKLDRDPRLRAIADEDHWTFVKFGQIEHMGRELRAPEEIAPYLGLEPLIEQKTTQMELPLDE